MLSFVVVKTMSVKAIHTFGPFLISMSQKIKNLNLLNNKVKIALKSADLGLFFHVRRFLVPI